MDLILIWIVLSIVAAVFAGSKGRSGFGWFLISCLLSPLIGLLLLAILPRQDYGPVVVHNSLEDKLLEINALLEKGLLNQEEYNSRRKAIIESTDA
jgi:hypothetical protein